MNASEQPDPRGTTTGTTPDEIQQDIERTRAQLGRTAEAEQEYLSAVVAEVEPGRKHFRRGQWLLRFHRDRLQDAQTEFEQAIEILPEWGQARSALAEVKELRGRAR